MELTIVTAGEVGLIIYDEYFAIQEMGALLFEEVS